MACKIGGVGQAIRRTAISDFGADRREQHAGGWVIISINDKFKAFVREFGAGDFSDAFLWLSGIYANFQLVHSTPKCCRRSNPRIVQYNK